MRRVFPRICVAFPLRAFAESIAHPGEFVKRLHMENLNFYDIHEFLEDSQLPRKLQGFIDKASASSGPAVVVHGGTENAKRPFHRH